MNKTTIFITLIFIVTLLFSTKIWSQTLAWNVVPNVTKYKVKCATISGKYLWIKEIIPPTIQIPFRDIVTKPDTYFCIVVAVNKDRIESISPEETFILVPDTILPAPSNFRLLP